MTPRRRFLVLSASGLIGPLAPIACATPTEVAVLIAQLVGDAPLQDGRVKLDLPVMVENGNSVGMTVSVDAPVGQVRSIDVFADAPRPERAIRPARRRPAHRHPHASRHLADRDRRGETAGRQLLARQRRSARHPGCLYRIGTPAWSAS
jgi:hypothetical protein